MSDVASYTDELIPAGTVPGLRQARQMTAGFAAVVAAVVLLVMLLVGVPPVAGLLVAVVLSGLITLVAYRGADSAVLRLSGARQVEDDGDYRRYHNLVEGVAVAAGLPKPQLYVVDDPAPNALVCAISRRTPSVVVTTGALAHLDRVELEGVVAQLLVKARGGGVPALTLATTLVAGPMVLADAVGRVAPPVGRVLLLPAPVVAWLIRVLARPQREVRADVEAVGLTRYPPGLAGALHTLEETGTALGSANHATAHLWLAEPLAQSPAESGMARLNRRFATHPPLEERVALLHEL